MYGEPNTCKKCSHKCHCKEDDCKECINDVCVRCKCKEAIDIPSSFTNRN